MLIERVFRFGDRIGRVGVPSGLGDLLDEVYAGEDFISQRQDDAYTLALAWAILMVPGLAVMGVVGYVYQQMTTGSAAVIAPFVSWPVAAALLSGLGGFPLSGVLLAGARIAVARAAVARHLNPGPSLRRLLVASDADLLIQAVLAAGFVLWLLEIGA